MTLFVWKVAIHYQKKKKIDLKKRMKKNAFERMMSKES